MGKFKSLIKGEKCQNTRKTQLEARIKLYQKNFCMFRKILTQEFLCHTKFVFFIYYLFRKYFIYVYVIYVCYM